MRRYRASLFFLFFVGISLCPCTAFSQDEIKDPWEGMNRGIFWFNDKLDIYLAEPVARGYNWAIPNLAQQGVTNFFNNLEFPSYFVSDIVQFKFGQAAHHTGRFLVNTTLGVGGIFDVAQCMGLEHHYEDFGIALAYHGVGPGPYLVLPFFGPSNLRDAVGRGVDSVLDLSFWFDVLSEASERNKWIVTGSSKVVEFTNVRASLLPAVEAAKESSLDYYLFAQSAYYQYRMGVLNDGASMEEGGDWFDDEEFLLEEKYGLPPSTEEENPSTSTNSDG